MIFYTFLLTSRQGGYLRLLLRLVQTEADAEKAKRGAESV